MHLRTYLRVHLHMYLSVSVHIDFICTHLAHLLVSVSTSMYPFPNLCNVPYTFLTIYYTYLSVCSSIYMYV